jgi:DNA-binding SARP family transcriptional activator
MERRTLSIRLLGGFEARVDGRTVPADAWARRSAADLVKLLALESRHRLTRDQVADALWPDLDPEAGATNTRRAAHFARRALGAGEALAIRGGAVELGPGWEVVTDVETFERAAQHAFAAGQAATFQQAAAAYPGDLLPDDRYEQWCAADRERLRGTFLEMLAGAGRFEDLIAADPAHEPAHRAIIRDRLGAGDRAGAIRQFERLRAALQDLGLTPDATSVGLYKRALDTATDDAPTPAERARALLAWGIVHWERADLAEAEEAADQVRALAIDAGLGREYVEAAQLLGLIAYAQGGWRDHFGRAVVEAIERAPEMAPFIFDAHVCMSEFSLHEPDGLAAALPLSDQILAAADRAGSVEGRALSLLLRGEAGLLEGGPSAQVQAVLAESAALNERTGRASGSAVATERLAQAADQSGDATTAERLHARALELAAQSPMVGHLIPFVYGGMIRGASIDEVPRLLAAETSACAGLTRCETCAMALHVAAVSGLARLGDIDGAREQLRVAERTASRWSGGDWDAALLEAGAALRRAEGASQAELRDLLHRAAGAFDEVGRRYDADRCRTAATAYDRGRSRS